MPVRKKNNLKQATKAKQNSRVVPRKDERNAPLRATKSKKVASQRVTGLDTAGKKKKPNVPKFT